MHSTALPCRSAGLRTLVLENTRLATLPPCLTAASRLEELKLQQNDELSISETDVDDVLARLPVLRLLWLDLLQLSGSAAAERMHTLAAGRPQLELRIANENENDEESVDGLPVPA